MTTSTWVIDVNETNFEAEVLERSRSVPIVVDFWAPWCGPCRTLAPLLEKMAEEHQGQFILAKVNVDEAQQLAAAFQIDSIPAVMAFRDAQLYLEFKGLIPEPKLREFIARILPNEAERAGAEAAKKEESDPQAAEAAYRGVLEKDPRNAGAFLGLARIALARGDDKSATDFLSRTDFFDEFATEAEKLRNQIELRELARPFGDEASVKKKLEADPKSARLKYELGCVLAASSRYRDALETLLAAAEADPKLASSAVREAMVKIFHVLGVRSELSDEFRAKLARLLY
jgi:putative thioredoxin